MANVWRYRGLETRFALKDRDLWKAHLFNEGYAVIRGVASPTQVDATKSLIWDDIEFQFKGKISRNDARTWSNRNWFDGMAKFGIVPDLAQSQGAWLLRGLPAVKDVFAHIWNNHDLLVSMDSVIARRPEGHGRPRPNSEGLHLDQNPFDKRHCECVQGMLTLLPVTMASGGLMVVPQSQTEAGQQRTRDNLGAHGVQGDWVQLKVLNEAYHSALTHEAVLLLAEPGDLILWDSRTIHGGRLPYGPAQEDVPMADASAPPELERLACTISMTPREFTDPAKLAELRGVAPERLPSQACVMSARREGLQMGAAFNHVPHEPGCSNGTSSANSRRRWRMPHLDDNMQMLVDGQAIDPQVTPEP